MNIYKRPKVRMLKDDPQKQNETIAIFNFGSS